MNAVDIFCVRETFNDMINIVKSIKFEMHRPVVFNRFD